MKYRNILCSMAMLFLLINTGCRIKKETGKDYNSSDNIPLEGIYENVAFPAQKIYLILLGDHIYRFHKINPDTTVYQNFGRVSGYNVWFNGDTAMEFSGPFQVIGPDGWTFIRNGNRYYYDMLGYAYGADENIDSTHYLIKRTGNLPADFKYPINKRVGEQAPVPGNLNLRYAIWKIHSVVSQPVEGEEEDCYVFHVADNNGEDSGVFFYMPKNINHSKLNPELIKFIKTYGDKKYVDIPGKIWKIYFEANGEVPGNCYDNYPDPGQHCSMPVNMELLD